MKMSVADKRIKLLREDFEREGKSDKAKAKFIKELQLMKKEAEADCMSPLKILDVRERECQDQLACIDREIERDKKTGQIGLIIGIIVIACIVSGSIVAAIFSLVR